MFKVKISGTPSIRFADVECTECGHLTEDVWKDEFEASDKKCQACENGVMVEVFRTAPHTDFHDTKKIFVPGFEKGHQTFSSHREVEQYAASRGKVVMTKDQWEQLPIDTPEERMEKNLAPLREKAFEKTKYRLEHGYNADHGPVAKESDLKES